MFRVTFLRYSVSFLRFIFLFPVSISLNFRYLNQNFSKMTKAIIYGNRNSPRVQKAIVASKIGGRHVTVTENFGSEKKFSLNLHPAFEDGDVHLFSEIAIAAYLLHTSFSPEILQWVHYGEEQFVQIIPLHFFLLLQTAEQQNTFAKSSWLQLQMKLSQFEKILENKSYLVDQQFSFADASVAMDLVPIFQNVLTEKERSQFFNVTQWFHKVVNEEVVKSTIGEVVLYDNVTTSFDDDTSISTSAAPMKPAQSECKKKLAADEDTSQKKFVGHLAALSPPKFDLKEFKLCYEDSATKAIQYFMNNFDPTTHSIWKSEYTRSFRFGPFSVNYNTQLGWFCFTTFLVL